jgi:hypothetical protein
MTKYEKQINDRFDDIVSRLDATQRVEASIHKILSFLVQEIIELKHEKRRP